jgi:hypothetical protein
MRGLLSVIVAFASALILSSCALLSGGSPEILVPDDQLTNARMEKIAEALNDQDAAALKAMFSPYALEQAVDIDERLEYVLSFFPNGGVTWEYRNVRMTGDRSDGKWTELLAAYYTVSADGNAYDVVNPDNVGIYAMGVTPLTDDRWSGPAELFGWWAGSMTVDESDAAAYPGVYVPDFVSPWVSDHVMDGIVEELDSGDGLGLEERFSKYARTQLGVGLSDRIEKLFGLFPDGEVAWELQDGPVIREAPGDGDETAILMLSRYRVSSGGEDYWLSFAYFPVNEIDPSYQGIYAIGVAPRTESADSTPEEALFAWADSFDVGASTPPGIVVPD